MFIKLDFISKIILIAGAFFGLPFLGIGLTEAYHNIEMSRLFTQTKGTIVQNTYSATNDSGNVSGAYFPVIEFTDANDKKVRFTEGIGSLPPDFEIGERVDLFYNPQNTKEARIITWKRLWLVPTILSFVGLLPVIISLIVVWKIEATF